MGTPSTGDGAGEVLQRPKEKMRFVEDMTEAEAAKVAGAIPAGLQNLGNTCYMNVVIQILYSLPSFVLAMERLSDDFVKQEAEISR